MKRNLNFLSYLIVAIALVLTSCGKDDPSPEEEQIKALTATWTIDSAAPTGFDAVTLNGASITFKGDKTYSVTGISVLNAQNLNNDNSFAESGTFALSGDDFTTLTLTSGGTFTITALDPNSGDLSVVYNAKYPKTTSSAVAITLEASLQN